MIRVALAASLGLAVAGVSAIVGLAPTQASSAPVRVAAPAPPLSQLLGFVDARLVRVHPETLHPLPGKGIAVGSGGCAPRSGGSACWSNPPWTVSPDGKRLALARNDLAALQLVDAKRLRVTTKVRLSGGSIGGLAWIAGGRMLALEEICCRERQRLVAVDLARRQVVVRRPLGGSVEQLGRTAKELVLLLAPAQAIGPARIAVADGRGAVRFAGLERILAGTKVLSTGSDHRVDSRSPGLAVDPQRRRAFVIDQSLVAEVDLETLAVSYHELHRPASLLTRLWNWLEPAAAAKQVSGYGRSARWLGGDLLAVSGTDTEPFVEGEKQGTRVTPTGLLVVDTGSWNARMVDRGATSFRIAGDLLLATGWSWDSVTNQERSIGLAAYGFDGAKRFQLFDGTFAWLAQVYGGRAYLGLTGGQAEPLRIVDLATGRVVGVRQQPLPWLLLGTGSGWWG